MQSSALITVCLNYSSNTESSLESLLILMCDGSVAQCQIKEMFLTRKQLKFWEQGSRPDAENCACAIIKLGKDASHQNSRERYQTGVGRHYHYHMSDILLAIF